MDFKSFEVNEKNWGKPGQRKYFGCPPLNFALGAVPVLERQCIIAIDEDHNRYHASSFSKISALKKASRHFCSETFPFLVWGTGSERVEKTLYVVEV